MKAIVYVSFALGVAMLVSVAAQGQAVFIDKPVRVGEVTVFPSVQNPNEYYYLVDKARLALAEDGKPQFSFLRYVQNAPGATKDISQEGEGGGIVHAVVTLGLTDEQLDEARREIRRVNPDGNIVGPVIYTSGKFGLVSSFAEEGSTFTHHLLGLGSAPILDGNKAAISLNLTKQGAKILWESFKTATPDVTFSFEMQLEGYRSPIQATLEANFDQIYKHKGFEAGIASAMLQAEVTAAFDDLVKNGAIKFTGIEADENMEKLIEIAYKKLTDMMMEPVNNSVSQFSDLGRTQSTLDRASNLLSQSRRDTEANNRQIREENRRNEERARRDGDSTFTPRKEQSAQTFTIAASYKMKEVKTSGIFKVSLNKIMADELAIRFDENIGSLNQYAKDETRFRQINLDDPFFRQREVSAFLDGYNASEFGQYINFVTVKMLKTHAKGATTEQEIRIDRTGFNEKGNLYKMVYGWKDDTDRRKWLDYEYEVLWSFFGGQEVVQEKRHTTFSAINLKPPFEPRTVSLDGDPESLKEKEVRSVTVSLFYKVGGQDNVKKTTLSVERGQISENIGILLPENQYDYEYEIQWRLKGNRVVNSGRHTSAESILFIDELPE
ncbi:MAG: hypothetical protein SF052_21670 [Bacteroidia bacterium]|nr:hypothetical protein [Bacteroidia bacterium]